MKNKFLTQDNVYIQIGELGKILTKSVGYEDFYNNIENENIKIQQEKTYEVASSGFVDFNQHLYEDINHMNSISSGIYIDQTLIVYKIFIWGSKGEGFEIFRHILLGKEIDSLKIEEQIKEYMYTHLKELEDGIIKTYNDGIKESFEKFGKAIENRALPLQSILQFLSLENNINDFR